MADHDRCDARTARLERRVWRERRRREELERYVDALARAAVEDPVTGLATRAVLADRLHQGLQRLRDRGERLTTDRTRTAELGLLLVDLDDFRSVNDRLGRAGADGFLRALAQRLAGLLEPGDALARLHADVFGLLLVPAPGLVEAASRAEAIRAAVHTPVDTPIGPVAVTASMGLRLADGSEHPEAVLREAEAALYVAKTGGNGRLVHFDSAGATRAARRAFEADLRRGLGAGELGPWFQPVVDLRTGRVCGAEALARWTHHERGNIPPVEFVDQAEEAGLIDLVTDRILLAACQQVAAWSAAGTSAPELVHVNLSGLDLVHPHLVHRVQRCLEATGVAPDRLCLEITERALVGDDEAAQRNLAALRRLGVSFAIDDFGVEYASFAYLRRFPVEVLKIDRSFIVGLTDDARGAADAERGRAVLGGMVAMARALGMRTVAEGVETAEQAEIVRALGIDEAQGWLFGRPEPAAAWPAPWLQGEPLLALHAAESGTAQVGA